MEEPDEKISPEEISAAEKELIIPEKIEEERKILLEEGIVYELVSSGKELILDEYGNSIKFRGSNVEKINGLEIALLNFNLKLRQRVTSGVFGKGEATLRIPKEKGVQIKVDSSKTGYFLEYLFEPQGMIRDKDGSERISLKLIKGSLTRPTYKERYRGEREIIGSKIKEEKIEFLTREDAMKLEALVEFWGDGNIYSRGQPEIKVKHEEEGARSLEKNQQEYTLYLNDGRARIGGKTFISLIEISNDKIVLGYHIPRLGKEGKAFPVSISEGEKFEIRGHSFLLEQRSEKERKVTIKYLGRGEEYFNKKSV